MNVEKLHRVNKIADIVADVVAVKQEEDRDVRHIPDDPIRPFKIERCADLNSFDYLNNDI